LQFLFGCLAQRFGPQMFGQAVEIDMGFGVSPFQRRLLGRREFPRPWMVLWKKPGLIADWRASFCRTYRPYRSNGF
jgi:hypothetical protein